MTPGRMYYFSYGHNTNRREMRARIPSSRLLGAAHLPGYRLMLERYANVVPDPNSVVHGVLYSMPEGALPTLDADESYGIHYRRRQVRVLHRGRWVRAMTYVMMPSYRDLGLPSVRYVRWIARGYQESGIPLDQLTSALRQRLQAQRGMASPTA